MTLPKVDYVSSPVLESAGDARGQYGFGRPAHAADPQATYHFEIPEKSKVKQEFVDEISKEVADRQFL